MDPPSSNDYPVVPPSRRQLRALRLPGEGEKRFLPPPYVDERLVRPGAREEMVRGRLIQAAPANPAHGDRHCELDYLVRAHVAPGYVGSVDLLTRAAERSDFATDACVRRAGVDPRTNSRYLEELAFEVINEQSMRHVIERAEDLTACGVRRLIGIFVKKGEVRQWSGERGEWVRLPPSAVIDDPTLTRPMKVRALLDAAVADDEVVRALDAKGNRQLRAMQDQVRREGFQEGRAQSQREAVERMCRVLGISLDAHRREWLGRLDADELAAWLDRIEFERQWPE